MRYKAIVIGTSSGGINALASILTILPANFPLPIIVVQHLHYSQDENFYAYLKSICFLRVKSADDKEPISPGTIYFAPPNYHLLIEKDYTFSLTVDSRVCYSRPSIDVLFESAADVFMSTLVGVILTGANDDGSRGLREIARHGGLTIVQDPATAEFDYMPQAALEAVKADHVLALQDIGPFLMTLARYDLDAETNN